MSTTGKVTAIQSVEWERIVNRAKTLLGKLADNVVEFAKLYAETISRDPAVREKWCDAFPQISRASWKRFEGIAEQKIDPMLAVCDYAYSSTIEKLPLDDQRKLLSGPVPVVVIDERGKTDVLNVEIKSMPPSMKRQLIAFDHIRTVPEQKVFLESEKTAKWIKKPTEKNTADKYQVFRGKIVVTGRCELTLEELLSIIKKMKK